MARRAGVSKGAVSLALNGRPGVSPATRKRILAAAEALSWQPSARGRALSESRSRAIGLVLARPPGQLASDPFFGYLLAGIETTLAKAGYALVLSVVPNTHEEGLAYRRLVRDGRIDGVLLTDVRIDDFRYDLVTELGLEAVVLGHPDPSVPLPSIAADERGAVADAIRMLAAAGHERIGHVSGPLALVHAAERRGAWRDTLTELGLPPAPEAEGDFTGEGGARATRWLLARRPRPTAIFYANDLMAISGLAIARELGVEVAAQLSIVGFDDTPLARHVFPPLTTIRQDPVAAGAAASAVLLSRLAGKNPALPSLTPASLVERQSVGPAAFGRSQARQRRRA